MHPFSGEIRDGYGWGRGAIDMKHMVAMSLAVARQFKRDGTVPPRDIVFAFLADEEAGGFNGARRLVHELGIRNFGVESPGDGAAGVAATWQPAAGTRWHQAPAVHGGIRRVESREQFRRYTDAAADSPLRDWVRTIADLPD